MRGTVTRDVLRQTFHTAIDSAEFRRYWIAQAVSQLGYWFQSVALVWTVYQTTHSPQSTATLLICQAVPQLVAGLFAGSVVDAGDARSVLLGVQVLQVAFSLVLAGMLAFHAAPAALFGVVALRSVNVCFAAASQQKLVYELAGERRLGNALALTQASTSFTRVAGPALAGELLSLYSPFVCVLLNAVSYVPVIFTVRRLLRGYEPQRRQREPFVRTLLGGVAFARADRSLQAALLGVCAVNLFMSADVLLPVVSVARFHGGASVLGIMYACLALGAVAGALSSSSMKLRGRVRWLGALICLAAAQILCAITTIFAPFCCLLVAAGFSSAVFAISNQTVSRVGKDAAMQGRISGLYTYVVTGSGAVGALVVAAILRGHGVSFAYAVAGLSTLVMGGVMYLMTAVNDSVERGLDPAVCSAPNAAAGGSADEPPPKACARLSPAASGDASPASRWGSGTR